MSVINTNVSALVAQTSLRSNGLKLSTAMERLSTGSRINSAKDDAAGQAISERMSSKIRGYAVAVRNANDGISLMQTAEGDLNQIATNLQRIRELAVQSSNSVYTQTDRDAMNTETTSLVDEIDRIAQASSFNGTKLLDGTFSSKVFQVGAGNVAAEDRISATITSARAAALGASYSASVTGAAVSAAATTGSNVQVNGVNIIASVAGSGAGQDTYSAYAKAVAINASSTGVTATASTSLTSATAAAATGAIAGNAFQINGVAIGAIAAGTSVTEQHINVAAAINAISAATGVTATANGATGVNLATADGRNIVTAGTLTNSGLATAAATTYGSLTLSTTSTAGITLSGTVAVLGSHTTTASALSGTAISAISIASLSGANTAVTSVDSALTSINTARAATGAYQNRFGAAMNNLETSSLNLSASRSRIMDTDYATETTNLAKAQIISQAATAMLAQANQSQQSVLALLK